MPTGQQSELHHSPDARFQSGNRVYRIVILGQGGVGKSAITLQFVTHTFQEDHDPTIEDAYQKQVVIDKHVGILDVLDTAGQDEFTAMREQYMRGGEGFILVYSVTEKRSFQEIRRFKEMIDRVRNYETVPMVIAGNKSDLDHKREVSTQEGAAMAKEFGCPFHETSAALRYNIDEVFHDVVRCIRVKENDDYYESHKTEGGKVTKKKEKGTNDERGESRLRLLCCLSSSEND